MAKRNHQFIGPTPVSDRRTGMTPQKRLEEHIRRHPCRWLTACNHPAMEGLPLCINHAVEIYEQVKDLEEAVQASYRTAARRNREFIEDEKREVAARKIRESRGHQPGWIYYLRVADHIKIGYSTDITRRLRSYPPGSPLLAVHPGTPALEKELHQQFVGLLDKGREWFRPDQELLDHCAAVVEKYGDPKKFEYRAREANTQKQVTAPRYWSGHKTA